MGYMGGKHRVGKKIAAVVDFYEPVHYHEPFCGMFGVGKHVNALCVTASDVHQDLIMMLKAVRDGWRGPEGFAEEYWSLPGVDGGDNIAWAYADLFPAVARIKDRVAFYSEIVDITLDGVPQVRPRSVFSEVANRPVE